MSEVTQILSAIEDGDPAAAAKLLPLVYDELRKLAVARLAHERPGQTLQATALVHEAYLKLVGTEKWDSRGHFFAAAAEAMRRILITRARDKNRLKRGGGWQRLDLDQLGQLVAADSAADDELLALDEALERLDSEHPVAAQLVKLRFFAGLTADDAAQALGISLRTANRHWAFARAWLYDTLRAGDE